LLHKGVEALFRQALEIELKHVPSRKPFGLLMAWKESTYLPVCVKVLELYPRAQPATHPDPELALAVCELTNPKVPALQLSVAGRRELERRYFTPAPS
jgi:hypothetical protein